MTEPGIEVRHNDRPDDIWANIATPPAWMAEGTCRQTDPELFYYQEDGMPEWPGRIEQAKAVCRVCPVRGECLEWALESEDDWAIMGGLTPIERRRLVGRSIRRRLPPKQREPISA